MNLKEIQEWWEGPPKEYTNLTTHLTIGCLILRVKELEEALGKIQHVCTFGTEDEESIETIARKALEENHEP